VFVPPVIAMKFQPKPRLGVSHCLAGAAVRYDGGHKRDDWIADTLARHVDLHPVCPEAEAGLGTPREPMHLARDDAGALRLLGHRSGTDCTPALQAFLARRVPALAATGLDGFVLKADSPSCGLAVPVTAAAAPSPGLFAAALTAALPDLPIVEETALGEDTMREAFCIRVFARARLRNLLSMAWTPRDLSAFHAREKMLLLAHDRGLYDRLGRTVAAARARPREEVARDYAADFMRALATPASIGNHLNALQHMAGHFKGRLDAPRSEAIHAAIERYRAGALARGQVLTLLREMADQTHADWVREQSYLAPCPQELLSS
jgi:uncharacterized protein YbgA (DUF1722 family)/uncharacterized protein YbbK (DUF523 family)